MTTISTAYYDQLADDLEESGTIETAKDIRKLVEAHKEMHHVLRRSLKESHDEELTFTIKRCLRNTKT